MVCLQPHEPCLIQIYIYDTISAVHCNFKRNKAIHHSTIKEDKISASGHIKDNSYCFNGTLIDRVQTPLEKISLSQL